MTAKSVLLRPGKRAPTCPLCYAIGYNIIEWLLSLSPFGCAFGIVVVTMTSDKSFAWAHGKFSEPLTGKVFSKKALDLFKVLTTQLVFHHKQNERHIVRE